MKKVDAVKELDNIFLKYKIKDERNILGFRNNFIDYIRTLNKKDLKEEYDKKELLYEFVELQKKIGIEIDLLSEYTMMIATNSKNLKQCFTPFEVTKIMSKLTKDQNKNTFYDCSAGTGQTLITAYCNWCKLQKHYDDTFIHLVVADDLDTYNVHCLIFNFATRGMNAQVYHRDTLTQEVYEVYISLYDKYGFSKIKNIQVDSEEFRNNFSEKTRLFDLGGLMKEIKVGEYVRTDFGNIGKYYRPASENSDVYYLYIDKDGNKITSRYDSVVKHSFNIIDLIEEWDYVNGHLVLKVEEDKFLLIDDKGYTHLAPINIKSIATKEQFEKISYKVEG